MKLPIDRTLESGGPLVLPLHHGKWAGRSVSIDLEVCADPTCGCAQVDFHCRPCQGAQASAAEPPALVFALDLWERRLCDPETGGLSHEAHALGKAVMAELEEEDWQNLFEYLTLVKQEIMKTADLSAVEVAFPPEIMDGDESLVGYDEIFPFAALSSFELGGHKWEVDDQYCVDPDCDCASASLTFVPLPQEAGAELPAADDDMPSVLYNYNHGRIDAVESASPAGLPGVEELVEAARAARLSFDTEVKTRHLQLRNLLLQAMLREQAAAVPVRRAAPKIGRNDPCPCGSGRKYKECCATQAEDE